MTLPQSLAQLITIPTAAREANVSSETAERWYRVGVDGRRLRVVKVGRVVRTTSAWMLEFLLGQELAPASAPTAKPSQDERRGMKAKRRETLRREGLRR